MAIEYVKELWAGRRGRDGIDRKRDYVRVFEVRTTDPYDDPTVAGGTLLLPRNGQSYPFDPFALMVDITPDQHAEDATLWTVTCRYSTQLPFNQARETQRLDPATGATAPSAVGSDPTKRPENPLDRPTVWSGDYEKIVVPVSHDRNGVPVANSAGMEYDPPVVDNESVAVLVAVKNYAALDENLFDNLIDSVNNAAWFGRPARTVKADSISWRVMSENGVNFVQATLRFLIRRKTWQTNGNDIGQGWDARVIDQGFHETFEGVTSIYRDPDTGKEPERPVLLDGAGLKKTTNGPVFRTHRVKKEKDFNLLNL